MIFPSQYNCLEFSNLSRGDYQLIPIRFEDRMAILKWRNEQMTHLRQAVILTEENQNSYFQNVVAKLFVEEQPSQLLFSVLKNNILVGYGGLVHISWPDKRAEISFLMDTSLQEDYFEELWFNYLKMLYKIAFEKLDLHKLFTYAFDIRPNLYPALCKAGMTLDGELDDHCRINGEYKKVILHSVINPFHAIKWRKAEVHDAKLLFEWTNDPLTRQASTQSEPIPWENHLKWFNGRLADKDTEIMIFEIQNEPIGTLRLDHTIEFSTISYSIAPKFRGNGYGKIIVQMIINAFPKLDYKAYVKETNKSSMSVFRNLNFRLISSEPIDTSDQLACFYYSQL